MFKILPRSQEKSYLRSGFPGGWKAITTSRQNTKYYLNSTLYDKIINNLL